MIEKVGAEDTLLLTTNTLSEDDLWEKFVRDAASDLGAELVMLTHGLDVWDLAIQQRFIPDDRAPFCSRILKAELSAKWIGERYELDQAVQYFGIDWTEEHRVAGIVRNIHPYSCDFPLLWEPMIDKAACLAAVEGYNIPAYRQGMPHNNCLKYGCVRGGLKYWKLLLETRPKSYNRAVLREQEFRNKVRDSTLLRRRGVPVTLDQYRDDLTREGLSDEEEDDYGACSCMGE
ncbi:MAG: hypothetical protein OXG15_07095 [Gammaproteobacteria bacterium]|nr:hypothetical protein [Gammaproteobacteria bacterium]